jgi:hypothetical protein
VTDPFADASSIAALAAGDAGEAAAVVTAMMRAYCRQTISLVDDDDAFLIGTRSHRLLLPQTARRRGHRRRARRSAHHRLPVNPRRRALARLRMGRTRQRDRGHLHARLRDDPRRPCASLPDRVAPSARQHRRARTARARRRRNGRGDVRRAVRRHDRRTDRAQRLSATSLVLIVRARFTGLGGTVRS